jgi:hypothetical protein
MRRPAARCRSRSRGPDVRLLKQRYPGVPVVTYVNTSADVRPRPTSAAPRRMRWPSSIPSTATRAVHPRRISRDECREADRQDDFDLKGHCEVHERFTAEELLAYKENDPTIEIIAHPECHPDVIAVSDFAGSTSGMIDYVKDRRPARVLLVTECSMASNVEAEVPGVDFVKPCNLCPHMKRITLPKILDSLLTMTGGSHDRSRHRPTGRGLPWSAWWRSTHERAWRRRLRLSPPRVGGIVTCWPTASRAGSTSGLAATISRSGTSKRLASPLSVSPGRME